MKIRQYLIFLLISSIQLRCSYQTDEYKIMSTSKKIIVAIDKADVKSVEQMIGTKTKDYELIEMDVKDLNTIFHDMHITDSSEIEITNLYNHLGQREVRIPIANVDTLPTHLDLLFGPSSIIPLDKISGYRIIWNNSHPQGFSTKSQSARRN